MWETKEVFMKHFMFLFLFIASAQAEVVESASAKNIVSGIYRPALQSGKQGCQPIKVEKTDEVVVSFGQEKVSFQLNTCAELGNIVDCVYTSANGEFLLANDKCLDVRGCQYSI